MISNVYSVKHTDTSLSTCFNTFLKFCLFLHWQDFQMISCECLLFKVSCVGDERDRMIRIFLLLNHLFMFGLVGR